MLTKERLKKTMSNEDGYSAADEAIRKESMCINQSLTYLEQVSTPSNNCIHLMSLIHMAIVCGGARS